MFVMKENGLERFIEMQEKEYDLALNEIKNGRKKSCWMWYIFPQIRGLGKSSISKYYGISDIEEGKNYLLNEKLRHNLIEISQALLNLGNVNITEVIGFIDDFKLKSSMTLFNEVEQIYGINCGKIFEKVLIQFFKGEKDQNTLKILEMQKQRQNNNKENSHDINNEKRNSPEDNKDKENEKLINNEENKENNGNNSRVENPDNDDKNNKDNKDNKDNTDKKVNNYNK